MKEFSDAFRQVFVDRLRNRFFGSFVLAWLLYNWKALSTLFFNAAGVDERIASVEDSVDVWSFLVPVVITIAYLGLSPWISFGVDILQSLPIEFRKQRKAKSQKADLAREIDNEDLRLELQSKRLEVATAKEFEQSLQGKFEEIFSQHAEEYKSLLNVESERIEPIKKRIVDMEKQLNTFIDHQLSTFIDHQMMLQQLSVTAEGDKLNDTWGFPIWDLLISQLPIQLTDGNRGFYSGHISRIQNLIARGSFPSTSQYSALQKKAKEIFALRKKHGGGMGTDDSGLENAISLIEDEFSKSR